MILFHTENLPHYGLERIFELAKRAGFDGLEIGVSRNFDTQSPNYIKKLEERYGLPVKAFSIIAGGEESLMEAYQKTVREFPNTTMILEPSRAFSFQYKKWLSDVVPRLAQKYELQLCRKNAESQTVMGFLPKYEKGSLNALKEAGNVCLDLSAMASSGQEIMRAIPFLGDRLRHVYLSNFYRETSYALLDKGILPLESFLTKLAHVDFRGSFTLRVSPMSLGEGEDERIIESMQRSIKFYETYFLNPEKKV